MQRDGPQKQNSPSVGDIDYDHQDNIEYSAICLRPSIAAVSLEPEESSQNSDDLDVAIPEENSTQKVPLRETYATRPSLAERL